MATKVTQGVGVLGGATKPKGSTATQKRASQPATLDRSPNLTRQTGSLGEGAAPVGKSKGKAE
jgi:hypothetical protein